MLEGHSSPSISSSVLTKTGSLRPTASQVLSATLGHCYGQYYRCVTELLADLKIGERKKFNIVTVNLLGVLF